jgi:uncharacterized protein YajQ (UPF0234 family)
MPSFDIVSEVSHHELTNVIDQVAREISNRFDFKGTSAKIESQQEDIWLYGDNEFQLDQIRDIFLAKASKRQLEPGSFEFKAVQSNHANVKRPISVKQGISTEFGKKIIKLLKDAKLKVQASIQQDQVRVTGKKRDDLQEAIAWLKQSDLEQPLQFQNFRD